MFVAGVLLCAAVMLIFNTIRMAMYARRREIEVMKLVGATNWFIRIPFMLEGLVQGVFGALVGIGALVAFKPVFEGMLDREQIPLVSGFIVTDPEAVLIYVGMLVVGCFVGAVRRGGRGDPLPGRVIFRREGGAFPAGFRGPKRELRASVLEVPSYDGAQAPRRGTRLRAFLWGLCPHAPGRLRRRVSRGPKRASGLGFGRCGPMAALTVLGGGAPCGALPRGRCPRTPGGCAVGRAIADIHPLGASRSASPPLASLGLTRWRTDRRAGSGGS
ncbi:MAG: FtsX-like permease family protein [Acidimicrobiia bacterium]|nr:FtsX-like permease family protein [Acidimicrobiia bacterium]